MTWTGFALNTGSQSQAQITWSLQNIKTLSSQLAAKSHFCSL